MFNQINLAFSPSLATALAISVPHVAAGILTWTVDIPLLFKCALWIILAFSTAFHVFKYALLRLPGSITALHISGSQVTIELHGRRHESVCIVRGTVWLENFLILTLAKSDQKGSDLRSGSYLLPVTLWNTCRSDGQRQFYRQSNDIRRLRALVINNYFELQTNGT